MSEPSTDESYRIDRDELAELIAEACDDLAERWWSDRDSYLYALEHDPFWEEPIYWLEESRPPVRSCGAVLAHVLTEYEPGEDVDAWAVLEWINRRYEGHTGTERRIAHGFYRATSAIRDGTDIGWPNPDPILGELA